MNKEHTKEYGFTNKMYKTEFQIEIYFQLYGIYGFVLE